jgi:hypothetical protein
MHFATILKNHIPNLYVPASHGSGFTLRRIARRRETIRLSVIGQKAFASRVN